MTNEKKASIPPKVILIILLIIGLQLAFGLQQYLSHDRKKQIISAAHAETVAPSAHVDAAPKLAISRAYSPEAPPVVKVLAGYMILENKSAKDVSITRLSSPDFDKVEIHSMESKDGMMHMVEQKQLKIPAGKVISLQPGELHMMLIGPHQVFHDGDIIKISLELDNGEQQNIDLPVRKRNF